MKGEENEKTSTYKSLFWEIRNLDQNLKREVTNRTLAQRAISTISIPTTFGSLPNTSLHMFNMQTKIRFLQSQ